MKSQTYGAGYKRQNELSKKKECCNNMISGDLTMWRHLLC